MPPIAQRYLDDAAETARLLLLDRERERQTDRQTEREMESHGERNRGRERGGRESIRASVSGSVNMSGSDVQVFFFCTERNKE